MASKKNKTHFLIILLIIITIASWLYRSKRYVVFEGSTMGTTYSVKCFLPLWIVPKFLYADIENELEKLIGSMSTYHDSSSITLFNLSRTTDPFQIPSDFYDVLVDAKLIYGMTAGCFDPTIKPILDLWGIGKDWRVPLDDDISRILPLVGFNKILLLGNNKIAKTDERVQLDLSSIAKGYGVDVITSLLSRYFIRHAFVEIGGEVRTIGSKPMGYPWKVGIQQPVKESLNSDVAFILSLNGRALATSGDYRQYFKRNGEYFSHIIDPRTGYPVKNGTVSVSVLAPTCAMADGLATGLMLLDPEEAVKIVETFPDFEVYIIKISNNGSYTTYYSSGFND